MTIEPKEAGYYYLINRDPVDDKLIWRPVRVVIIDGEYGEGYWEGERYTNGVYIQLISSANSNYLRHISIFEEENIWEDVQLVKMEPPKEYHEN